VEEMKVFLCSRPDEAGKFHGVVDAFPDIWEGCILDVGCRSGNLKHVLGERSVRVRYLGLDLSPPADVIANLEKGLPFSDKTLDVVVALDVLEHTDNIHEAFDELCRIARKFVVITLPNIYELKGRIKFLLGRPISGKYGLPPDHLTDRHRWLFSFKEARQFVHFRARKCCFEIEDEGCLIGPRRSSIVARALVSWFPNLFSPWYLVLLKRQEVNFP
jgi:SAM-dependent methyltransferase